MLAIDQITTSCTFKFTISAVHPKKRKKITDSGNKMQQKLSCDNKNDGSCSSYTSLYQPHITNRFLNNHLKPHIGTPSGFHNNLEMSQTRAATARLARLARIQSRHPQAAQHFTEGVASALRQWTALELAVHHQWGGPQSAERAEALIPEIVDRRR